MPATVREITVRRTAGLDAYRSVSGVELLLGELSSLGARLFRALGPRRVWMLNSTASGGGVAEMMPKLCALLNGLGIDARWLVLEPDDPAFFRVTKALHNLLHGEPGLEDLAAARAVYDRVSREAALRLKERVVSDDLLVVHDPQPAGAGALVAAEHRPELVWRSHIGLPYANDATRRGWAFLHDYLAPYRKLIFSAESYIPEEHQRRSAVLHPGIDPLSHKNRELRPYKLVGILRAAGLLEGPPVPPWAHFEALASRYESGRWVQSPIPGLLHGPVLLQVSRFDRLKGFQHLIPAFERLLDQGPALSQRLKVDTERAQSELGCVQLVLAGPDPEGVCDDPEAAQVLDELCARHRSLPAPLAARVHLVRLPMVDVRQNALAVNALQRLAAAAVQNSLKEGFGLTVSEALWKRTPVIASNIGGLGVQIRAGTDGLLVNDPTDAAEIAEAMLVMLAYPKEAERMACAGQVRVRDHFLVLTQLRRWLEELLELTRAPAQAESEGLTAPAQLH
ncbi:MAG: glycosyltransferase [Myxococcales bacterium]